MKFTTFLFTLFIAIQGYGQGIIMSPIGAQEVYENARITVYFSTLKHFESITLSSPDLPSFGTLMDDGNGSGRFVFDPTSSDVGTYTVTLNTESGSVSSSSRFKLEVKAVPSDAIIYYVDPINGSASNPGTAAAPFSTLTSVLMNNLGVVQANTFFYLRNGFHGSPIFTGSYDMPVYILAERNNDPGVKRLNFSFTTNWYVSGLHVSPQTNNETSNAVLVNVFAGSLHITITNCKIYSIEDASVWTTNEDWYANCGNGIIASGKQCMFKNNFLKNTWFSVELRKSDNEFSYNIIDWFGADAIRGLANNQKVQYNQIKNATVYDYFHPTQPQHDDGFQSWTFSVPVKNMVIRGNQIADIADPNLPLPTEIMQGIVDFDGFAEDWVVENNLVITHHAHGIALYGAKNCKVVNNTVVRNPFNYFFPSFKAWIRINPRKESAGGDLSTGNLVRNNIMATYQDEGQEPASVDNNTLGTNYSSSFQDYQGWNFYLSANSPAIDAGIAEDAPFIDADKKRRTVGAVDRGCFEYNASTEDRDAPTLPSNISASQITEGSISLDWDASSDNEGVAYYEINIDGKIIRSATPSAYIPNLQPNTEYTVGVKAVDFFDNKSPATLHTETTQALGMMAVFFVSADRHDHVIKSNSKLMWVGMPYLRVGGYYGSSDASAVLPFKLPCLESNYQIVSANLATYLDERVGATEGSLDVYGLGIRPTACVATTDHWEGMYSGDDANGTLITQNYITPQTNTGLVELASSDESALGTYLQGLYDIGGCDGFAYLRLNENTTQEQNNTYYKIVSADNSNSFQVPLLKVIASESTAVKPLEIKNGVAIFPNPTNGKEVTMQIKGFEAKPAIIVIHNAKGQEVFRKTFNNLENESTLNLKTDLVSGMYFVTVLGRQKYAQTKLIVALR